VSPASGKTRDVCLFHCTVIFILGFSALTLFASTFAIFTGMVLRDPFNCL